MAQRRPRVSYFYDSDVGSYHFGPWQPMKPHRMRMTHELVGAYNMLNKMTVLRPRRATPSEMTAFHTDEYIHFLQAVTPETQNEMTGNGQRYLCGSDNPAFDGLFEFCSISAGGSIAAAEQINSGASDIAINWSGGLHHAKKREASGFCYVNDIVLCILELLRSFQRVLYIDIDIHHGDGVEEAFYQTDRVMTVSFHKFGDFFPGTGHIKDTGREKGKGYAVNVPLSDGVTDDDFKDVYNTIISRIMDWYRPGAVVLQCGADSLSGDRLGCFNMTMEGHAHALLFLKKYDVPLVLLGGGGYTVKNVARTWTYETACALGMHETLDRNLPYTEYFDWFGPRYRLEVLETNMDNLNHRGNALENAKRRICEQLRDLPFAPSAGMREVPSESLGEHLGFEVIEQKSRVGDGEGNYSEVDEAIMHIVAKAYAKVDEPTSDSEDDTADELSSDGTDRRREFTRRRRTNGTPNMLGLSNVPSTKPPIPRRRFFRSTLAYDKSDVEAQIALKQQAARIAEPDFDDDLDGPAVGGDVEYVDADVEVDVMMEDGVL